MSNKSRTIAFICALCLCLTAGAQTETTKNQGVEFGGRIGAGADFKLSKKLHLDIEEELRMDGEYGLLSRSYTTLGASYKISSHLKAGAGYSLIFKNRSEEDSWQYRMYHRGFGDLTGHFSSSGWKFSLRERFQATYRSGEMNIYQNPRTKLELKSRIKAQYGNKSAHLKPYAAFEVRNLFNGVKYSEDFATGSYEDAYINRLRLSLGTEWVMKNKDSIDLYTLWDYNYDKVIDATKAGVLKSITHEPGFFISLGVAYTFGL